MNERLSDAVRAHYEGETPSPERLRRLAAAGAVPDARLRRARTGVAAAFASLAALFAIAWLAFPGASPDLGDRVAAEIALNHEKLVDPDVRGSALPELAAALERLDFTPRAPTRLADAGLALTGARYCSLQGQLAVQLQLEDPEGRRVTLYQTRRSERFAGLDDTRRRSGGTRVELWSEGDVLLGLARSGD